MRALHHVVALLWLQGVSVDSFLPMNANSFEPMASSNLGKQMLSDSYAAHKMDNAHGYLTDLKMTAFPHRGEGENCDDEMPIVDAIIEEPQENDNSMFSQTTNVVAGEIHVTEEQVKQGQSHSFAPKERNLFEETHQVLRNGSPSPLQQLACDASRAEPSLERKDYETDAQVIPPTISVKNAGFANGRYKPAFSTGEELATRTKTPSRKVIQEPAESPANREDSAPFAARRPSSSNGMFTDTNTYPEEGWQEQPRSLQEKLNTRIYGQRKRPRAFFHYNRRAEFNSDVKRDDPPSNDAPGGHSVSPDSPKKMSPPHAAEQESSKYNQSEERLQSDQANYSPIGNRRRSVKVSDPLPQEISASDGTEPSLEEQIGSTVFGDASAQKIPHETANMETAYSSSSHSGSSRLDWTGNNFIIE